MPELPDVEGFRVALTRTLPGRRIEQVEVLDAGVLRNATARTFRERLTGHRFEAPGRHGKWLFLPTDGPVVMVHSGMTGRPYYAARSAEPDRFDRLRLRLDRGEFRFTDLRKLRGIWVADSDATVEAITGKLGPDALDLGLDEFVAAVGSARRILKTALTDQSLIAGLGNLLADEICWQAGVHPLRRCSGVAPDELRRLHNTMRRVLRTSVRHARVPALRNWLTRVRDDRDAVCPRCGTPLSRARNAGRMTVWCPADQRSP